MAATEIHRILRTQAWERAKGELKAMLHTFFSGTDDASHVQYLKLSAAIDEFIEVVEGEGMYE